MKVYCALSAVACMVAATLTLVGAIEPAPRVIGFVAFWALGGVYIWNAQGDR